MSVAFRRDSDEEHLEPRFELPLPPGPNLVTPRGYALIEARNVALEEALAAAPDEDARKVVLRDRRYWSSRLASAQIVAAPSTDRVAVGSRVTFVQGGAQRTLEIVGHDETDPAAGLLSFGAPLARALLGAEVGEEVDLAGSESPLTVLAIDVGNGWD
jgi:transcription elongation GreA/GreB family factor